MHLNSTDIEQDHRLGRIRLLDEQRVNLDGFAEPDPDLGMISHLSPHDPAPSWVVAEDGSVLEMDSTPAASFDTIDEFIVRYAIDHTEAPRSMAMDETDLARMIVDSSVPRERVLRVCAGLTPAKMARVVSMLQPVEIQMAMMKMRARRTPANQAHVTNRLDDPLLIAADAATAVVYGFRELEATVPVLDDAPAVAVGLLIGSQVPAPGALTQCSVEEARELELGVRGLVSYAETVSVYGTEQVFTDGDDTPWSKAFLTSSYASRGIKMRLSSGAGSEVLIGPGRAKVHELPGVSVRGAGQGHWSAGCAERRYRRCRHHGLGARRCSRTDRREPDGHAARAGVVQRQRQFDVRVDDAPNQPDVAGAVVRVGFHLLRVWVRIRLRQHVRAFELQCRRSRRLPGAAAGLGRRRGIAVGRPDHAGGDAAAGRRGHPCGFRVSRPRRLRRRSRGSRCGSARFRRIFRRPTGSRCSARPG